MYVYRICDKEEIDIIFNYKSFKLVGDYGSKYIKNQIERNVNNHNYDENEKYLHFFKKKEDIYHMNMNKGRYICVYDIPEEILEECYGIGKYWHFINYNYLVNVEEYAINTEKLKFDYLIKVDRINQYIDEEECLYGNSLNECLEPIYDNGFIKGSSDNGYIKFEITEETIDFILNNPELFPIYIYMTI